MNSSLSRILTLAVAVGASLPGRAQNNAAPQAPPQVQAPLNNLSLANSDALAMLGAFYNKTVRAKSFRGHLVATKTSFGTGTTPQKKTIEVDSSWVGDPAHNNATLKNFSSTTFTSVAYGKTSVESIDTLTNGTQNHVFWRNKGIWSENVLVNKGAEAMLPALSRVPWISGLSAVLSQGNQATTEHRSVDGREQVVLRIGWNNEYVFDAPSGDLLSWKSLAVAQNVEYVWSKIEFDTPLPDSIFAWKIPAGATQVTPKETTYSFTL